MIILGRAVVKIHIPNHGSHYMWKEDLKYKNGPIFTRTTDPKNFTQSYAHLYPDGKVVRFLEVIAHVDDLEEENPKE